MYGYSKQRQTQARSMLRAVVLKPRAVKLQNVY